MDSKRRSYSPEFKSEVVELAEKIGDSKAANELGVCLANIQRWKSPHQNQRQKSHQGRTNAELEKENRRLQKELGYLKKINEVLKKSTAIFSNDQMQNSR